MKQCRVFSNNTTQYKETAKLHNKQFPTLDKESLESLSLISEQTLKYGALDLIKDCF